MSAKRFGQIILAGFSLLLALCLLIAGGVFLYRKAAGESSEQIVNGSVEFLLEHLPTFVFGNSDLKPLDSPLESLPLSTLSYREFRLADLPADLKEISQEPLNILRELFPSESFVLASLPSANKQGEDLIYFFPYTLTEQESFTDYLNKTWPTPDYTWSPEKLAGFELWLLSAGEESNYYLLRLASNYLALSESKSSLAKLLQTLDSGKALAQEVSLPTADQSFYRSFTRKNANPDLWQKILNTLSFNQAEYSVSTASSSGEQEVTLQQELYGSLIKSPPCELRLSKLTPEDVLFYFEAADLGDTILPLLGSLQNSDSKLRVNDWVSELKRQSDFDLEQDLFSWTKDNFSLSVLPTSDATLFTYAFSLLVEVDEREEAQSSLTKLERALVAYFNAHKPETETADYKFVEQTLGELKLRSLPLYPELGLHYTFLDDKHLLFSTHLEGISAYSKVRPDKDALSTRNAFEQALTRLQDPQTFNALYWQVGDSSEFLLYLIDKYWPGLDASLARLVLPELDTLVQVESNKTNYVLTNAVLSY